MRSLFHITSRAQWTKAQTTREYKTDSLMTEGFIHLSYENQVAKTANRFFQNQIDMVLLEIDPSKLKYELREEPADGDTFPHLYGALNVSAVVEAYELKQKDGSFVLPPELQARV